MEAPGRGQRFALESKRVALSLYVSRHGSVFSPYGESSSIDCFACPSVRIWPSSFAGRSAAFAWASKSHELLALVAHPLHAAQAGPTEEESSLRVKAISE